MFAALQIRPCSADNRRGHSPPPEDASIMPRPIRFSLPLAALVSAAVGLALVPMTGCSSAEQAKPQPKVTVPVAKPDYWRQLPPGQFALRKITDPSQIPDFSAAFGDTESRAALAKATAGSVKYLADHPSSRQFFPSNGITHERALESLQVFSDVLASSLSPEDFNARLRQMFDVYQSVGCDDRGTVLFTGYYRPIFDASPVPTAEYRFPLYKRPPDLVTDRHGTPLGRRTPTGRVEPYYTRGELEQSGYLKGLELAWLKDKFEVFIIHVQGSAMLHMTDGSWWAVGYAGKTDRPYTSVSEELIKDGRIKKEERNLQRLRRYFREHPADLDTYLNRNECFVFFTRTDGGAYGSLGVPVTPLRTIATDKGIYPRAAPAFLVTKIPGAGGVGQMDYRAFALDQDTGGAIRAPGRADIFMGTGPEAEAVAGHTLSEGKLFYLFLKDGYARNSAAPAPSGPRQPAPMPPLNPPAPTNPDPTLPPAVPLTPASARK
jgi:membrane-bound lytic murein transglycosylase A